MKEYKENELLAFKRKAIDLGLCALYKEIWNKCFSKADLMNMALDANGAEFMADSIAFDWGLSRDFLVHEFGDYINGKYQRSQDGYTGEMYVGASGVIKLKSTITLVAYCDNLQIDVPECSVGKIYVCGESKVRIDNKGDVEVYEYGRNKVDLNNNPGSRSRHKKMETSLWNQHFGYDGNP